MESSTTKNATWPNKTRQYRLGVTSQEKEDGMITLIKYITTQTKEYKHVVSFWSKELDWNKLFAQIICHYLQAKDILDLKE